jgi:hypothetical protein
MVWPDWIMTVKKVSSEWDQIEKLDSRKWRNLFRDLMPQNKRDIHLLTVAVEEGIVAVMMTSQHSAIGDFQRKQWIAKFRDHTGVEEEFALWTIDVWCEILSIKVRTKRSPK